MGTPTRHTKMIIATIYGVGSVLRLVVVAVVVVLAVSLSIESLGPMESGSITIFFGFFVSSVLEAMGMEWWDRGWGGRFICKLGFYYPRSLYHIVNFILMKTG